MDSSPPSYSAKAPAITSTAGSMIAEVTHVHHHYNVFGDRPQFSES